jgi:hypothetical protein
MSNGDNEFNWKDGQALKEFILAKIEAQENALELARENLNNRFDGVNKFREVLQDQASRFITRIEHDALIDKYDKQISSLCSSRDIALGKASMTSVYISYVFSIISIFIGMLALIK